MAIEIKAYNEILGEMVRKLVANTPLNDISAGSALLTLLEAAAQVDFENNASILSLLELLNIDTTRNIDLDARAADYGLERYPSLKATGAITITDTSITKQSTGLYQVKPAPIAGQTTLFVNDASDWAPTGQLFIGRGTPNFEGPISYTSIVNNVSFYTITLSSALQKDHLISETVVNSQGTTDRVVAAGTLVYIPANNQNPQLNFLTVRDAVIPSGEDTVSGVSIIASVAGQQSNASINTITNFGSQPFPGATATNTVALTNGQDAETDDELRERIKSYASTLARGTKAAILNSVIGVSDAEDNKQVASASITEPPALNEPSILYVDDGTGFQPSFTGQSVDVLVNSANGDEEFLQLSNFPLPRPQVVNTAEGPYELSDGMTLRVLVDGIEDSVSFTTSDFVNIASARIEEVIVSINRQSTSFKATFTNDSKGILLFTEAPSAETIQVVALAAEDDPLLYANSVLLFPTTEFSHIRLYQNNTLLREKQKSATLFSGLFSSWNVTTSGNLVISVDGTPNQDYTFTTFDFGGVPFNTLTLSDWVAVFNKKFAGVTATETASGRLQLTSNKEGAASSLEIVGGTYMDQIFGELDTYAAGQNSDFELNRQTGNLRILRDISIGDSITAGTVDAKGSLISDSSSSGTYNVSTDAEGRTAELLVVPDDAQVTYRSNASPAIGATITISDQGSNTMRVMCSSTAFESVQPRDYLYITYRAGSASWFDQDNCGLFQVIKKGGHTSVGVDTYVEVKNFNIAAESFAVIDESDIQFFSCSVYPQLWKGTFVPVPASASLQEIISSFSKNLVNTKASIFKTSSLKVTSATENDGSIAIPVSVGRATNLYETGNNSEPGNQSHIASAVSTKDLVAAFPKVTYPTSTDADGVSGKTVWLDRVSYGDVKGTLTENSEPGTIGFDTYSNELQSSGVLGSTVDYTDIYSVTSGNNDSHYRSIKAKLPGDRIGTQFELPNTIMKSVYGDAFNLLKPISLSPEDSIVFILDQDAVAKTIDIPLSRLGKINTTFPATDISFSADDKDNEPGVTFSNLQAWGTATNNTNFQDYAVFMNARNWYVSGGAGSGGSGMILRAAEKGQHGEGIRFSIGYPSIANKTQLYSYQNTPDYSLFTYYFGSDIPKTINLTAGDTFTVTSLGSDNYRYTFSNPSIDLSALLVDDIASFLADSGVSTANRGQLQIKNVNIPSKYFDVYNPNGAVTGAGTAEVTSITTAADVVGTQTVSVVSSVTSAAALDGKWFQINDIAGSVAVYYDVGTPAPLPGVLGVNRIITVGPLTGAESAATVTALTAGTISADPEFDATYLSTTVTITNSDNGAYAVSTDGTTPTGFSFAGTLGSANNSLNGRYFTLQDSAGSVAFWIDTTGSTQESVNTALRSVRIGTIIAGDSANTVAAKIAMAVNADTAFSATALANVVTVTDAAIGARSAPSANTSGFTLSVVTPGVDGTFETVLTPSSVQFFSLIGTAVADIVDTINTSPVLTAAAISGATVITKATKDEVYTPAGPSDYSASLSHGHDPDPMSGLHTYVSMYDGINWVKEFSNVSPNFVLKTPMTLQGSAPLAYSVTSCPNVDASTGEYFSLVPVTLNNIYHHFTQKALSQLPIVASVDVASNIRNIQIKSKQLGSSGSVEIVGGNGNNSIFAIQSDAQPITGLSDVYGELKIASNPVTFTTGDTIKISNTQSAKRKNPLRDGNSLDTIVSTGNQCKYLYNPNETNINQFVKFTVTDVSASYGRAAGIVWRWAHNDAGSLYGVTADVNGLPSVAPATYVANGSGSSSILGIISVNPGSATTPLQFKLGISGTPAQAEYYTFRTVGGDTFAVWFDVDAAGIAPTGATYTAATTKIEVDITSVMTPNQIISAVAATLGANVTFLAHFNGAQSQGATFANTLAGDLLNVYGTTWTSGNKSYASGDGEIAGFPIINVGATYVDVVNVKGTAMVATLIGNGTVTTTPTPVIKWNLTHYAKPKISQIILAAPLGAATVTCSSQHRLKEGDTVAIQDNGLAQTVTVASVLSTSIFTFTDTTGLPAGTYAGGFAHSPSRQTTRYKMSSIGLNNILRLSYVDGDSPRFIDCGLAVDDKILIKGDTFRSANSATARIIALSNTDILFENAQGVQELDTFVKFNNLETSVTWTANGSFITGIAGSFKNLATGQWVKKADDDNLLLVQITGFLDSLNAPTTAALAVKVSLGNTYKGTSGVALGVSFDEVGGVGTGVYLDNYDDICGINFDSCQVGDSLFVDKYSNSSWFNSVNSGNFTINTVGTYSVDLRPFVQVTNSNAQVETNRLFGVNTLGFFIRESDNDLFETIRFVKYSAIDPFNSERRQLYVYPSTGLYKMSTDNNTRISAYSKMGYSTGIVTGIDGYTYYTGLMRTVQRIVDGYEPDPVSYPGRRAVGASIEALAPLINKLSMSLEITTNDGVNLNEISSDIASAIIRYVNQRGVGQDVILSEIIVRVMSIAGVAAVTFTNPSPSTERISIADNERALIFPDDIFIS